MISTINILIIIICIIVLIFISLLLYNFILKIKYKKIVLNKLKNKGSILNNSFTYNNKTYDILFLFINKNNKLTVNSNTIMQITNLRSHKSKLFNYDYSNGLYKLIFIIPYNITIYKVLNENEVDFSTYSTKYNNFSIISLNEMDDFLKGL